MGSRKKRRERRLRREFRLVNVGITVFGTIFSLMMLSLSIYVSEQSSFSSAPVQRADYIALVFPFVYVFGIVRGLRRGYAYCLRPGNFIRREEDRVLYRVWIGINSTLALAIALLSIVALRKLVAAA